MMHVWHQNVMNVLILQSLLVGPSLVLALLLTRYGSGWLGRLSLWFGHVARRRTLAVVLVGVLAAAESFAVLLFHVPYPKIQDEFSYVLAGDTFASGRLTNPAHPMWEHFESPHVIQQPTYSSKFPPAQGLALAAGEVTFGAPVVGVKISFALACAAICWMLQGWVPPRWAFLGGLLTVLGLGGFGYWSQSYWGGAVAACGGALVFGALPRLRTGPRVRDALLLGLGLAILANSRPFEGLIASLPAAAAVTAWLVGGSGPRLKISLTRVLAPIASVLIIAGALMALHNVRVTGSPIVTPYQLYESVHATEALLTLETGALARRYSSTLNGIYSSWAFYLGLSLSLPLVAFICRPDRWGVFALLTCLSVVAALFTRGFALPHYFAPVTGLLLVPVLQGMRVLGTWKCRGRRAGRVMLVAIVLLFVASSLSTRFVDLQRVVADASVRPPWNFHERPRVLSRLAAEEGKHLVIVRYRPNRNDHFEWVYNGADIDAARVVWAHELGADKNRRLMTYFSDRRIWLLDADTDPPSLVETGRQTSHSFRGELSPR